MTSRWSGAAVTRRTVLSGLVGAGAAGVLTACVGSSTSGVADKPVRGGTLRAAFSSVSPGEGLDPIVSYMMFSKFLDGLIYDQLLTTDLEFQPQPMLAEDWTVSPTADVWKFRIRQGARFHDGSPVTSRDVAATFKRILDPATGAKGQSQLRASLEPSGISTPDASTLVLTLWRSNALLASTIGGNGNYFAILPDSSNNGRPGAGAGSGPFKVKDFRAGTSFEVARNDEFWGDEPYLDAISAFSVNQQSTKVQSVTSGGSHLCDPISFAQARTVRGAASILEVPNAVYLDIALDLRTPPFDNPKVIEAIKTAAGRDTINKTAFGGFGVLTSDVPVPPVNRYYPPERKVPPGDIARAKQLLAEAGFPDGVDITLHTADVTGGMVDLAVVFAQTVKAAGIRVAIRQGPPSTYFDNVFKRVPAFVSYWSSRPPLDLLNQIYRSDARSNESGWRNPQFDALLDSVAADPNADNQQKFMQQAMTKVADGAGTIIPSILPYLWVRSAGLGGLEPGASGTVNVRKAYLSQ